MKKKRLSEKSDLEKIQVAEITDKYLPVSSKKSPKEIWRVSQKDVDIYEM